MKKENELLEKYPKKVAKLNLKEWTKKDYQEYIKYLQTLADKDYRLFHQKLTTTKYQILGIRVPIQRKIAKEIMKGNPLSFLKFQEAKIYEEVNIRGFVIASLSNLEALKYLDEFIKQIDNWAICDSFVGTFKITKENETIFFQKAQELLTKKEEFEVRTGLVFLLSHFVKPPFIKLILNEVDKINREEYYINMAIAWLVAECFIKDRTTINYIKNNNLNKFTQNKTISKIRDSYRVSKDEKELLKQYRK